jgi:hypothetical protein
MNPRSARALTWVSLVLVFIGPIATSRAAMFLFPLLAALAAMFPAGFGRRRTRLTASVLLAVSLAVAFLNYPGFKRHMDDYAMRTRERAAEVAENPQLQPPNRPVSSD